MPCRLCGRRSRALRRRSGCRRGARCRSAAPRSSGSAGSARSTSYCRRTRPSRAYGRSSHGSCRLSSWQSSKRRSPQAMFAASAIPIKAHAGWKTRRFGAMVRLFRPPKDKFMQLTGGQALARQLVLEGVTDLFGIPGVQLDWAVDGLRQVANQIRYVVPRHEQAASFMADGYARTTAKIGTCMVVPGPGLLNAMAGLATAYACNSPVLAIVGNIFSPAVGKGFGVLHEVRNQSGILGSVTKWQAQATTPAQIPALVREAVKQLRTGRPQPVGLEISHDVLAASADVTLIDPPPREEARLRPDPAMIEKGRGAMSDRHPLTLNPLGGRAVFAHADVALIVGSRFADTTFGLPSWPM